MADIKKELQKVVKSFRDALPDVTYTDRNGELHSYRSDWPKAMMTNQQIAKGTATVNFGCANSDRPLANAENFQKYEPFIKWCESFGVKVAGMELNNDNRWQLRVLFGKAVTL